MFYTYYIKAEGKYYFGSRTPKFMLNKDAKDDFMIHYFTSTKDERLREIIRKGEYEKAEIIKEYTNRQECLKDEELLIENFWWLYGTENCWNHQANGKFSMSGRPSPMLGKQHSEEAKQKNRDAHIGKTHTEDWKKQHSEAMSGEGNPMYGNGYKLKGRKLSKEAIEKAKQTRLNKSDEAKAAEHENRSKAAIIREANKTLEQKLEINEKISEGMKKVHANMSKEEKDKRRKAQSERMSGEGNPMYGKLRSEEDKQKMRKPKSKFYWQTPEGEIRIMGARNAKMYHPDWVCLGPVE